ncbi:unnamed protein product [Spodoptera exigua]|nr:unnamed protein product [Spodoptera exigua]
MATGFVGSTKSFPFSFDVDVEDDEQGRSTPRLNKRIAIRPGIRLVRSTCPSKSSLTTTMSSEGYKCKSSDIPRPSSVKEMGWSLVRKSRTFPFAPR